MIAGCSVAGLLAPERQGTGECPATREHGSQVPCRQTQAYRERQRLVMALSRRRVAIASPRLRSVVNEIEVSLMVVEKDFTRVVYFGSAELQLSGFWYSRHHVPRFSCGFWTVLMSTTTLVSQTETSRCSVQCVHSVLQWSGLKA